LAILAISAKLQAHHDKFSSPGKCFLIVFGTAILHSKFFVIAFTAASIQSA